jgi:hypothetical protein
MERIPEYIKDGKWLKVTFSDSEDRKPLIRKHAYECETEELLKIMEVLKARGFDFVLKDKTQDLRLERVLNADPNKGSVTIRFVTRRDSRYVENIELNVQGNYARKVDYLKKHYKFDFILREASPKFYESLFSHMAGVDEANTKENALLAAEKASRENVQKILSEDGYVFTRHPGSALVTVAVEEHSPSTEGVVLKVEDSSVSTEIKLVAKAEDVLEILETLVSLRNTIRQRGAKVRVH